jgi:hypothetical protein
MPLWEVSVVTSLIAAALLLVGFSLWGIFAARDRSALKTASVIMAWLATAAVFVIPTAIFLTFLFPLEMAPLNLRLNHLDGGVARLHEHVPIFNRMLGFAIAAIPLAIASWGLLSLRKLFLLYASNEVFSPNAIKCLGAVSAALFWYVLVSFIAEGPITAAMSWWRPPGHRIISFDIGLDDLTLLFLAAVTSVITRVMAEAVRLADENAKFV